MIFRLLPPNFPPNISIIPERLCRDYLYRSDFKFINKSRVISFYGWAHTFTINKGTSKCDEFQLIQLQGFAGHSNQQVWVPTPSPYTTHDFFTHSALDTFCFKTPLRTSTVPTRIPSHSRGSKRHKENEPLTDQLLPSTLPPKNVRNFETSSRQSSSQSRKRNLPSANSYIWCPEHKIHSYVRIE